MVAGGADVPVNVFAVFGGDGMCRVHAAATTTATTASNDVVRLTMFAILNSAQRWRSKLPGWATAGRTQTMLQLGRSDIQGAFGVAVRDAFPVGGGQRQAGEEGCGLRHRLVRVIGGEHHPVHTDVQ